MGLREYARHCNCSPNAVSRAIESGRITVERDEKGRPRINPEIADAQWAVNTSHGHRRRANGIDGAGVQPGTVVTRRRGRPPKIVPPVQPPPGDDEPDPEDDDDGGSPNLTRSNAREKFWKAKMARLKYLEAEGMLVPVEQVKAEWSAILSAVRGKLLAVPSKVKLRVPALTADDVMKLQDLIREALEDLASQATAPEQGELIAREDEPDDGD